MKKFFAVLVSMAFLVCVAVAPVSAGGGKVTGDKGQGATGTTGGGATTQTRAAD